jgi:hypothetical protein
MIFQFADPALQGFNPPLELTGDEAAQEAVGG